MLSKEIVKMLNDQMNMELFSAYFYLDISNHYAQAALDGFAHWFAVQVKEEYDHAMRIRTYLLDNNEELVLEAMENPTREYKDLLDPLKVALEQEKEITASIHKIYQAAVDQEDYRTTEFLNWFVEEQLEEEVSFGALVDKFELFNKSGSALYILDKEFGQREG